MSDEVTLIGVDYILTYLGIFRSIWHAFLPYSKGGPHHLLTTSRRKTCSKR